MRDTNNNEGLFIQVLPDTGSDFFDHDGGRSKRTGNVGTASAHIITAIIGSGVLSLAWAVSQLGWVAGPVVMFLFSVVTYYTSTLLVNCYPSGDPVTCNRKYTYMDAVTDILGGRQVKICGWIQYINLYGLAISYTILASISMTAIKRINLFDHNGHTLYMTMFGIVQIICSQIRGFDQISWISVVSALMYVTYSIIGLGLGIAKIAVNGKFGGSVSGIISMPSVTQSEKIWRNFQALGDIAFACPFSMALLQIQGTIRSPPLTMQMATLISVAVTTLFYILCASVGYAALGDSAPKNLLAGSGFSNQYCLVDIANVAIVVYLVRAYQVTCQPLFEFIEKSAAERFPDCGFITREIKVPIPGCNLNLKLFHLVWSTVFVITTTAISMLFPFDDVPGLLGALGFWPLTVYYPMEMYIKHKGIPKWSTKWVCLQILSGACLAITIAAATGSLAGIIHALKGYKPFGWDD